MPRCAAMSPTILLRVPTRRTRWRGTVKLCETPPTVAVKRHVAAPLPDKPIAVAAQPDLRPTGRGAVSYRDGFVFYEMQPDDSLLASVTEMAKHGVPGHGLEVSPVFSLREDAVAERPSIEATLRGLGYLEYDLQRRFHKLLQLTSRLTPCSLAPTRPRPRARQVYRSPHRRSASTGSSCLGCRFLDS